MDGYEAPAAGVHRDNLAQFGLDGTQIHHHLAAVYAVEGFYGHQGNCIDRGGQHHEVGLWDALFERHDAVGQPEPQCLGGVTFRTLDTEYFVRDAAVAQREGKRAAYEAHARYQNFHTYLYKYF